MKAKRQKKITILILLMMIMSVAAVFMQPDQASATSKKTAVITIGGKKFNAELNNSKTTKAFMKHFPVTYTMKKLNGNEIYKYVNYDLPQNAKKVKKVHKGDIMLYGSDCIVIFYKTFETSYSYTKIGKITNPGKLNKAIKKKKVKVRFKK